MLLNKQNERKCLRKMDQRVRYTKNAIREVFLERLKKQDVDKITVRSICEDAKINRATFYKYYDNAYDLLDKLEDEILDELEERITEAKATNFIDVFERVLWDVKENYEIYQILFEQNDDGAFRNRLFSLCYRENIETINQIFSDTEPQQRQWIYYFIAEGCNGILSQWMKNNMEEPIESVVAFTQKIVDSINKGA